MVKKRTHDGTHVEYRDGDLTYTVRVNEYAGHQHRAMVDVEHKSGFSVEGEEQTRELLRRVRDERAGYTPDDPDAHISADTRATRNPEIDSVKNLKLALPLTSPVEAAEQAREMIDALDDELGLNTKPHKRAQINELSRNALTEEAEWSRGAPHRGDRSGAMRVDFRRARQLKGESSSGRDTGEE